MQAALYARRVIQAYDIVQGRIPRWCSSGATNVLQLRPARRIAATSSKPPVSEPCIGLVLSSQANYYRVRVDCPSTEQGIKDEQVELLCKKRSLLRKKGGYVLVGDQVELVSIDWQDGRGLVSNVLPRRTETANPRVANVDHFALVFSVREPWFEPFQVTRFLVAAEGAGITCSVLLNKCDLADDEDVQRVVRQVEGWGYKAIPLSVRDGQGMPEVRKALVGYTSVLAGPSGVGKSSIINALRAEAFDDEQRERLAVFKRRMDEEESLWRQYHEGSDESEAFEDDSTPGSSNPGHSDGPGHLAATEPSAVQHQPGQVVAEDGDSRNPCSAPEAESQWQKGGQAAWRRRNRDIYGAQAVGNVGHRSKRGRHTTRSAVLLDLPAGGLLVDTPGFNYPAMERVTPGNVQQFFPEIRRIKDTSACKFANCSHVHEPQCAVRGAQWERYPYYVRILEEAKERDEVENTKLQMNRRRQQGTTKVWKGKGGVDMEVARLEAKVHRRTSRNTKKLQVKELLGQALED